MSQPDPVIWQGILAHLRRHYPEQCRQWFEELEVADLSRGVLRVDVPHTLHLKYLQSDCNDLFNTAAQTVTGRLLVVRFQQLNGSRFASAKTGKTRDVDLNFAGRTEWFPMPDSMVLNPDYSFDNFVTGPNNRLAHAAAVAVAEQPGQAYNPFFIHGGVGLGKTHLLQAISQAVLLRDAETRIYYVSCEDFTSQFVDAVQSGHMSEFRHRFRRVDILVVDDIHFLAGHDRTQEEFFHTFNTLTQSHKQIVLSSDAAPHEIPDIEDRLVSRFKSGLVARINHPSFETRVAILQTKAALRGLTLPSDVVTYVAQRVDSNIRELGGAITQLQGVSMASERPIDIELAREALGEPEEHRLPIVSIQIIVDQVARHHELKPADLLSRRKHKSIVLPRQIAMYIVRELTDHSLQEVGGYFGGRDHTTVMYAVKKIGQLRQKDSSFHDRLSAIESAVRDAPTV